MPQKPSYEALEQRVRDLESSLKKIHETQNAVIESESRLQNVLENSRDILYRFNLQSGVYDYMSPSIEYFTGINVEDYKKGGVELAASLIHPDDQAKLQKHLEHLLNGEFEYNSPLTIEYRVRHPELGYFWLSDNRTVIYDEKGDAVAIVGNCRNITKKMEQQRQIENSEKHLKEAQKLSKSGSFEGTVDVDELWWSQGLYDIFGLESEKFTPTKDRFFGLIHPEDREEYIRVLNRSLDSRKPFNKEFRADVGGNWRYFETFAKVTKTNGVDGLQGTVQDITDRKIVEIAFRKSEDKYQNLFNLSREGFVINKGSGEILEANPAFTIMLGYTQEEMRDISWKELTPKKWLEWELKVHGKQLVEKGFTDIYEKEYVRKDGSTFPVELRAFLLNRPEKLEDALIAAFVRNVSERKINQRKLERELSLRTTLAQVSSQLLETNTSLEQISDLLLECGQKLTGSKHGFAGTIEKGTGDFRIISFTKMLLGQMGIDNAPLIFHKNSLGSYDGLWGHSLNTQKAFFTNNPGKHVTAKGVPDGHIQLEQFLSVPIVVKGTLVGIIALANPGRDFDEEDLYAVQRFGELFGLSIQEHHNSMEKIELQRRLLQTQKMEAIGTLAGGIAHDFNNILTVILGYTEILLQDLQDQEDYHDDVKTILNSVIRARELVSQILTVARQSEEETVPVRIQTLLKEAIKFTRASFPTTIEIRQNIEQSCRPVLADSSRIHQIIMNLITNARHAMGSTNGILGVTLKQVSISEEEHFKTHLRQGNYVCLSISDTGIGMTKDVSNRIFEPYFTTKEKDRGTGLGLAVCQGIVMKLGGEITVESEVGKGSTFYVFLPEADHDHAPRKEKEVLPAPEGSEHILLVDDETSILKVMTKSLEKLGYTVTSKRNGCEAWEAFCSEPEKYDLILTDLTMPQMTGELLSKKVLELKPGFPIIMCTGFNENMDNAKAEKIGIREVLLKPIERKTLAITIRNLLQRDQNE